jgi:hypothetical protein
MRLCTASSSSEVPLNSATSGSGATSLPIRSNMAVASGKAAGSPLFTVPPERDWRALRRAAADCQVTGAYDETRLQRRQSFCQRSFSKPRPNGSIQPGSFDVSENGDN